MGPLKVKEDVLWVGAVDWDRRLFDALIPLPDGTSYNAYLVKGSEKTALLDTVEPTKSEVLMRHLEGVEKIDYIVSHHAEQDHSGTIPKVLEKYPAAKVVCTPKGKEFLIDLLKVPEDRFITVADNETLSLGNKTLEFLHTPWVHWPETMVTYLREDRILFSCDLFGSHLAFSDVFSDDEWKVCDAAKRYYAEVMMPFRNTIKKHIERLDKYHIDIIAPSHGPAYDHTGCIMEAHREWISEKVSNTVVIPYATMHGSTEIMVERLTEALSKEGIKVERFNLAVCDTGRLAMAMVDAATIVIGSPTVLTGAHPIVISAAFLVNALRPKVKFASVVGSYGWGGRMADQVTSTISGLKVEMIEPVIIKGAPKDEDLKKIDGLASVIAGKHRGIGIL